MYGIRDEQKAVEVETPVQSSLIKAVENGNEDEVNKLIDAGVAVDEIDNRGMNALFEAVSCCKETLVYLLVEKGKAFVNARDLYGRTPLFYAITKSKKMAQYLIKKGADVNLKDFSNRSALSFFVENCMMNKDIQLSSLISGKKDEFEMLQDPSKDVQDVLKIRDVQQDITETILGIVFCKLPLICAYQNSKIWTKLPTDKTRKLNRETIEENRNNFSPALKVASTYFAKSDTKTKTNLESILKDFEGNEPCATMCNNAIEFLVESIGADPNFADSDGNTALHYAVYLPFLGVSSEVIMSMLRKLERYGLTINTRNHQNQTPLLFCLSGSMEHLKGDDKLTAMKGLVEVCSFLVTRGSSLEETTQDGESVFHLVIKLFQQGFEIMEPSIRQGVIDETMKILHLFSCDRLIKGRTVNQGNSRLNSPLHYWATLTLLFYTYYSSSIDMFESTLKAILEHLLKQGTTLNPRNEDEETPLHMCKTWSAVKLLLENGANPYEVDSSGRSPILAAANNKTFLINIGCFYPDVSEDPNTFWKSVIEEGLDPWTTDNQNNSVLCFLNESKAYILVKAFLEFNCERLITHSEFINITDNEGKTVLFYAVQQSTNESVVLALIDAGADVHSLDNEGETALFYAVQQNNSESVVRALIDAGADVNITSIFGEPALCKAVKQSNNERVVRALIDAGADINKTNDEGETALFYAVQQGNNESVVDVLIDAGADVNITDNEGITALFYAVRKRNNESVVIALIDAGADVNRTDNEGKTALFFAVQLRNNESVVRALIEAGADVNVVDTKGNTLLDKAWKDGNAFVTFELIHAGADVKATKNVNKTDKENKTLLIKAIENGYVFAAEQITKGGADVNIVDKIGKAALSYAVQQRNDEKVVHALIDAGADVNRTDNEGKTALFYVVQQSYKESVVRALIDAGADVNRTDNEGKTALFYVVQQSNKEGVVRALIDAGADVNRTDNEEKTALFYAVQQSNKESVVRALIDARADVNRTDNEGTTALFYAVQQSNNESVVRALIDAGADVNITDNEGKTALFYAVQQSNKEGVVRALTDAGADVNITDNEGKTALFYAVQKSNNESVVRALIVAGTDVRITDNEGETALFYAVQQRNNGSMVRVLIDAGADVNETDNEGKTALFYAVQKNNHENVRLLIRLRADVNLKYSERRSILFSALGNKQIAEILIQDGSAMVNARDVYGRTPMFYAMIESLETARLLIDKGANLKVKDNCNVRILAFFIDHCLRLENDFSKGVNLLRQKGIQPETIFKTLVSVVFHGCLKLRISTRFGEFQMESLSGALEKAKCYIEKDDPRKPIVNEILCRMEEHKSETGIYQNVVSKILAPLVGLGADPNTADLEGNTALHYATRLIFENVPSETVKSICRTLKEVDASFNSKNHRRETPVLFGLSERFLNELDTDPNIVDSQGNTALHYATRPISEEEDDASLNTKSYRRVNSISSDVTKENSKLDLVFTQVYEMLIENGSSVDDIGKSGNSLYHLILLFFQRVLYFDMRGSKRKKVLGEIVDLLQLFCQDDTAAHLTINWRDAHLNSPLHLWSILKWNEDQEDDWQYQIKILNQLLKCGARLNERNENDETPLHLCTTWRAAKLLIEKGANLNDLDSAGRTPLLSAALRFKERMKSNSPNIEAFYEDVSISPDAFWKAVFEKHLDPWVADKNGQSVLGVLVESEGLVPVKSLLDVALELKLLESDTIATSVLNAICKDRSTRALWKSNLVEIILNARKDTIGSLHYNGETPLHSCCRNIIDAFNEVSQAASKYNQSLLAETDHVDDETLSVHWKIAKQLLWYGADCSISDATGRSCLDIAESCPALRKLLNSPIDINKVPLLIPWTSVSERYQLILAKVARRQEYKRIRQYWCHEIHLASGSFGTVFAGISEEDGREVAIKRIEKTRMQQPESKREITNLCALAYCEQVIRYLSFFEDKNFSYLVLELMEGNLEEYLDSPGYDAKKNVTLCEDVLQGLTFLHSHNIVHRDLKPNNILYEWHPKLCLKIADFGLSRLTDRTDSSSGYGTNAGTRCWIAPEILEDTIYQNSKASDIFSCGLVLHYILSVKKHPFAPRIDALQHETETNILNGNMEGWDDSLCSEAAHLVKGMLDRDKTKRPSGENALDHPFFWSKEKKLDHLDNLPFLIESWKSISYMHKSRLAKVARGRQSTYFKPYWYHKDYLARGGFGAVFAGINEKDGREVAIKRIEKIRMQRPEDKREITNLTVLADCEQVVRYLSFFEDENFSYIVLELMEGNLDELLDHTISVDIGVKLCQDVVKGLKSLHDRNILHRDLKPTNILYKWHPELCLKIADFGLSRHIDCNSTTVYGTNAGTRCWIAPEVLTATKAHSNSSDVFACGLVLHYILSVKKHPFAPGIWALVYEIECNIANDKKRGWDDSLCPEADNLLKAMLDGNEKKRPAADKALDHPFFWSKKKRLELLIAVGNQPDFAFLRAKRTLPLTLVETDLETRFGTIVKYLDWNDPGYVHMPAIYIDMTRRRRYKTNSVVELVRFIRNAYSRVSELPKPIQDELLENFVFLKYFPNLVIEVYKAVTTHGWDQTREEIKYAMKK